jgi:hypothetical protein
LRLTVIITAGKVQDQDGGRLVLVDAPPERYTELLTIFTDAAYQGQFKRAAPWKYGGAGYRGQASGAEYVRGAVEALGG